MNRLANTTTTNEAKNALQALYGQLVVALQFPAYVWIGMVLLASLGICYTLTMHTRTELKGAWIEHRQIVKDVQELEMENIRLGRELELVEQDERTIETLAREAGMVNSDEVVLFLKPKPQLKAKTQNRP